MRTLLAAIFILLSSNAVSAQQPPADTSRDEEARALFLAGRTAFAASRYEDALQYFRRSYELSGRSELLYNIGTAADRLRRDQEAIEAYEMFLAFATDPTQRASVEERIRFLRGALSERSAEPEPEEEAEPSVTASPASVPASEEHGENIAEAWWLWTIIGVVVVGAGVGIGVGVALDAPGQSSTEAPLPGRDFGGVVMTIRVGP